MDMDSAVQCRSDPGQPSPLDEIVEFPERRRPGHLAEVLDRRRMEDMEQRRITLNRSCSSISNRVLKLALPSWPSHLDMTEVEVQTKDTHQDPM